jgi:hypothetical protein
MTLAPTISPQVASDGALETSQEATLTVAADPVTVARVSKVVQNPAPKPLAGVIIELGLCKLSPQQMALLY